MDEQLDRNLESVQQTATATKIEELRDVKSQLSTFLSRVRRMRELYLEILENDEDM